MTHDWLRVPLGTPLTQGVFFRFCTRCRKEEWGSGLVIPGDGSCFEWAGRPMFAMDADITVYWPSVRPCWEEVL
jgi:hypothetical protein